HRLERPARAGRHAEGDPRQAVARDRTPAARAGIPRSDGKPRRRSFAQHAGSLRRLHQGRSGQVAQGDPVDRARALAVGRAASDAKSFGSIHGSETMVAMLAWDELSEKRIHKEVSGGSRWNTYFFQPEKGTRLPQAFLVENTPHRVLRTHYHDVDQFQVIVQGDGTLGRHAVRPYSVHS